MNGAVSILRKCLSSRKRVFRSVIPTSVYFAYNANGYMRKVFGTLSASNHCRSSGLIAFYNTILKSSNFQPVSAMQDSSKSFLIRDLLGDLLEGRHTSEGDFITVFVLKFNMFTNY